MRFGLTAKMPSQPSKGSCIAWRAIVELSGAIADWLENFYNTERRHGPLN